jgi:hypothetical protein
LPALVYAQSWQRGYQRWLAGFDEQLQNGLGNPRSKQPVPFRLICKINEGMLRMN